MITAIFVLILFLLAFLGMAFGVVMGRKTIRTGCGGSRKSSDCKSGGCQCSSEKGAR